MNRNLMYAHVIIFLSLFLSVLYLTSNSIPLANASPGLQNNITQIPSEVTDFPGNNQQAIEILFTKASKSDNGDYHVKGSIKNIGENTLGAVKVTAQFLDENNKTIGITTCCNASPSDMEPGHTSSFDSFASINDMVGIPKYYKMSFDWKDEKSVRNELENNGNNKSFDTITNPPTENGSMIENILNSALPTNNDGNNNGNGNDNDLSCGQVVRESVKLSANLECSTDGLIAGADGITIDLNGFTITGPGGESSKVGIMLANNNNVQVTGGKVKGFQAGVLNTGGSENKISKVTFTENQIAIFDVGAINTSIETNNIFSNGIGVASNSSTGTAIHQNMLTDNELAGVTIINSGENVLDFNTITGSVNGVFLNGQSTNNNVNTNTIVQNSGVDINNGNGLPTNINANTFKANLCHTSVPDGLCTER